MALNLDGLGDMVTRQVGPLPAWAWAATAVAGVGAAVVIRNRFAPTSVGDPSDPGADLDDGGTLDDLAGTASPFLPGGFVVGGGPTQATGDTGGREDRYTPTAPETNNDWSRNASRYLLGLNYQGTIVSDALSRYLSGRNLTSQGQAIIDVAIAAIGAPPQPVPPPTVSPTPEPTPSAGGGGSAPPPRRPRRPAPSPPPIATPPPTPGRTPRRAVPIPPVRSSSSTVNVRSVGSESLYGLLSRTWGRAPSRTEWRNVANLNGLSVYRPDPTKDFEDVRPWSTGIIVKVPRKP